MRESELNIRPERMRASSIIEDHGALLYRRQQVTTPQKRKAVKKPQKHMVMDLFSRDPAWSLVVAGGALISVGILFNALFMQKQMMHPAPLWNKSAFMLQAPVPEHSPFIESKLSLSPKEMAAASTQNLIRQMQVALKERGFFEGDADGVWGKDTDAAMHDYAYAAQVTLPLEPSEALLKQILASRVTIKDQVTRMLAPSVDTKKTALMEETQIKRVQQALIKAGFGPMESDGKMGTKTRQALIKFEQAKGLPVSGQISKRNMSELSKATGVKF